MRLFSIAVLAATGLAVSGCATVIKGTTQYIAIETPPATGASCVLTSKEGRWTVTSPGVANVAKSKEDIRATCTKPGWQDAFATIPSGFEGWTVGNVLLGGIVGIGVDAATGASNAYPHVFQIPMQQAPRAPDAPASGKPSS